jgi:hypothetical protein
MIKSVITALLFASVLFAAGDGKDNKDQGLKGTPLMRSVSPDAAKAGEVLTVSGEYLDKTRVKEIYLTDGKVEFKADILEQNPNELKFKVPANTKTGRMRLMVLTTGIQPQLLEQPVSVDIQ